MGNFMRFSCWMWLPLAALTAACGSEPAASKAAAQPPISVRTARVEEATRVDDFTVTGTVESGTVTTIGSKIMGQILAVTVEEGAPVRAGQLLVVIDDRDAQAQVAQAEAAVAAAKGSLRELERAIQAAESGRNALAAQVELAASTFERFQQLLERHSVSRQEFEEVASRHRAAQSQLQQAEEMLASTRARRPQVEAAIRQAEAGLTAARNFLSYCEVTSPISGVVSSKLVEKGQMASPGLPLLTIEDSRSFEVHAAAEESRLGHVSKGLPARVEIAALGRRLEGEVSEIVPRADPVSRTFTVKVALPETQGLRSGLYATVSFPGAGRPVLTIPVETMVRRGQLVGVYAVAEDGRARFRLVKTGREWDGRVEVLSGLEAGEQVILEPGPQLQDGSPVSVTGAVWNVQLQPLGVTG
jgi:multidrug efflux pump subunit AcrA (membrane-fusion protein)